ncbi:hypothetical protein KIH74_03425 [Kineosporia sp. J2-2]|uniref:Uncharacterized protein n=1 Tax=Kineosporia corallincola TaxID=2835133 RepID=A0ABS5TA82_9ACTN|nr:hypothetical protein [Kineosporia corallincola]MBT0767958.1 hypothetical protein [Kineosporia corallincola]
MSERPSLPPQARHEAAEHLVGVGLHTEAQSLLSIDEADDAEPGIRAGLLAGDPQTAAKYLGRLIMSGRARDGEVDLVRGCIALVSGHAEGLASTQQVLERMVPVSNDWAAFAVTAAPHDLKAAARAANQVSGPVGPAVLAVQAAGRAAHGDPAEAHWLLDDAGWSGVGEEPTRRTIDLLKLHGLDHVAQELDAVRWQRRSLGESLTRRMQTWRRRRTERDLRCRCADTPVYAGEGSRYYVNWHLELLEREAGIPTTGEDDTPWRILFCARTGVRYLDRSSIPVTVRIGDGGED